MPITHQPFTDSLERNIVLAGLATLAWTFVSLFRSREQGVKLPIARTNIWPHIAYLLLSTLVWRSLVLELCELECHQLVLALIVVNAASLLVQLAELQWEALPKTPSSWSIIIMPAMLSAINFWAISDAIDVVRLAVWNNLKSGHRYPWCSLQNILLNNPQDLTMPRLYLTITCVAYIAWRRSAAPPIREGDSKRRCVYCLAAFGGSSY